MGRTALLSPDEALKKFKVAPGYVVNLFASELHFPLANPMALKFDARGRLWVANTPTWPQPVPGVADGDSIVILEDTNHDGRADKHAVFLDGQSQPRSSGDFPETGNQTPLGNVVHGMYLCSCAGDLGIIDDTYPCCI